MADLASMITDLGRKFNASTDDLSSRLGELEKRAARAPSGNVYVAANDNPFASMLLANREFGQFDYGSRSTQRINLDGGLSDAMASITSGTSTVGANTSAGTSLVPAHRIAGIGHAGDRELTVRDLLAQAVTTSNMVEYTREVTFTNNAKMQTEGETKGASDLTFELYSAPVRTLAHTFTASKQILDDTPALAGYIANRGVYGLKKVEEDQILFGNGTGVNLNGILTQATDFDTDLVKATDGSDPYARLRRAILQVRLTNRRANGILLHPTAAADIDLLQDGENRYFVDPAAGATGFAWRLPVVTSTAINEDDFVVADWQQAMLFDRQQATIEFSSEHSDYFARNLLMCRVEERLALAVFEPGAFVTGTFPTVTG